VEWVRTGTRCWRSTRKPAGSLGASSGAWARSDAVSVELLYLDDWQNWRLTLGRLTTALRMSIRPDETVVRRRVNTDEQAAAHGLVGSPTC
jgi:hypothetical protein